MGAGLHEYPLIFFTVIGQSVAGAFILMALVLLMKPMQEQHHKIVMSMFGLWVLMGVGFYSLCYIWAHRCVPLIR